MPRSTRTAQLEMTVAAEVDSISTVRPLVRGIARGVLPEDRVEDATLAVTEALGNAFLHAYPAGGGAAGDGEVTVRVHAHPGCLRIGVADGGVGFADGDRAPRTGLGLGLRLIRMLADHVDVRSGEAGTDVRMCFRSAPGRIPVSPRGAEGRQSESGPRRVPAIGERSMGPTAGQDLGLRVEHDPRATLIHVEGDLDLATAGMLSGAMTVAVAGRPGYPLVLEMGGVGLIDSTGLRVLLEAARRGEPPFFLLNPSREVRRMLDLTLLAATIRVLPDLEALEGDGAASL